MGMDDRDSLIVLRDAFDPSSGGYEFAERFYKNWFAIDPAIRRIFPPDMAHQYAKFARTMWWVLDKFSAQRTEEPVAFLAQLGRLHRTYGLTEPMYVTMHAALQQTMRDHLAGAWMRKLEATLNESMALIVGVMSAAAAVETAPAWWDASVVHHRRVSRDLAVVRLQLDSPMIYRGGQHVQVEIPQCPKRWRDLSHAIPFVPGGELEFHVRAVPGGAFSNAIVSETGAGDRWRLSGARGTMRIDPNGGDVLMIAGSTGIAPLRAMIMEMTRYEPKTRVHLFFGARYPCELYDLPALYELAAQHPWLSVTPVTEHNDDPPWAAEYPDVEVPYGLEPHQTGRLDDVVAGYGDWSDRQVLISGGRKMIAATKAALLATGTPSERIQNDLFK